MILEKLIVGPLGTNCYLFGSEKSKEVVIIDPGGNPSDIIQKIKDLDAKPIAAILTHGHFDHTQKVGTIIRQFEIPLIYNKTEMDTKIYTGRKANRWISEGDIIEVGELKLHILETPGHSPGSITLYYKEEVEYREQKFGGLLFTGDLLFRRSIGRSDFRGGDQDLLFRSIKTKIMNNPEIKDNFLLLPGHMGNSTVGEERELNMFKSYFT